MILNNDGDAEELPSSSLAGHSAPEDPCFGHF